MRSETKVYTYPNGEIQRVQLVRLDDWTELEFLRPTYDPAAFEGFCRVYREYLVPACPWIFGNMVLFHIPDDLEVNFPYVSKKYGEVADRITAAAIALRTGVKIIGGKPVFRNGQVRNFWHALEKRKSVQIVSGKLPVTTIIPVGSGAGFLSETEPDARMKVNGSFFIMDRFDCATVYDQIGTPLGLLVKDGMVENPPLFRREALLIKKDGSVSVGVPDLCEMEIEINGKRYIYGKNAAVYSRPDRARTPRSKGTKLVIIGCRVAAVSDRGSVLIPASGFVLCPEGECTAAPGDQVIYHGLEDVQFGIQVGNSIIKNGEKTDRFLSRFYNIRALERIPFPPSLYPLDFDRSRAARIALGVDAEGKPVILWAEGAGKLHYSSGTDSCGATLADMARICSELGVVNGVNLDGGGSAQILLKNKRSLMISDRDPEDNSECQRAVPIGLVVR